MRRREPLDVGKQAVDGRLVRPNDHSALADFLQLADGDLGFSGETEQALRVILEEPPRFSECSISRPPVEEPLSKSILDSPSRLADGGLGPVEASRRRRKAPVRRDRQKGCQ